MRKLDKNFILKATLACLLCFAITSVFSQEKTDQPQPTITLGDQVTMKIGGFLRSDFYYDTRKNSEMLDGLLDLYPMNDQIDLLGKDMNDYNLFRMSAAATRLNTKFTGPDVLKAKSSAFVEFDFTGYNGIGFRLRHAWLKLNWQNSELLFGRFWHPMFMLDATPTVLALSTGAPFAPFNRCEQLRFTYSLNHLSFVIAASGQMDYGFPSEYSSASGTTTYLHNQIMPDFTFNPQFKNDNFVFGLSGNYKMNQPRTSFTRTNTTTKYLTTETLATYALQAYGQIKSGNLKIKGGVLYGQNMMELLMMGGFAFKDTTPSNETYSAIKNMNYWGNIVYGDKLQGSIFFGYTKNLGSVDKTILGFSKTTARGYDDTGNGIDHLIRIAPCLSFKTGRVQLSYEFEYNIAAWGKYKTGNVINDYAKITNTENCTNTRSQFAAVFSF
jgi:hypothetical protein